MADETRSPASAGGGRDASNGFFWVLLVIAVAAFLLLRSRHGEDATETNLLGRPLPPFNVAGWFNTDTSPTADALRGHVVLIDCWASWCGPCRQKMPHMVDFYKKYGGQGLVLIGLTPESGSEVDNAKTYISSVNGLIWPIAYGAQIPIDLLGVDAFPTLILFDKSGKSIWASHGLDGLEEAVTDALVAE